MEIIYSNKLNVNWCCYQAYSLLILSKGNLYHENKMNVCHIYISCVWYKFGIIYNSLTLVSPYSNVSYVQGKWRFGELCSMIWFIYKAEWISMINETEIILTIFYQKIKQVVK